MEVIKLENVSKKYIKDKEEIVVLDKVNITFEEGKFYAIMGNSGSGKSTLLQCIGLLDKIDSGKIYINNSDVSKLNDDEISELRKENIGFIFQDYYLNPIMTAQENVMLPLYLYPNMSNEERRRKADSLLEQLDMKKRSNHLPRELSGGEQQRVAIARALANNPNIILADEPTGNLDKNNEEKIFKILKDLSNGGKCIIVVSHNIKIKDYADVVINIGDGSLEVENAL